MLNSLLSNISNNPIVIRIFALIIALLLGSLVLLISGFNPLETYLIILEGSFSKLRYIAYIIIYATPLILTGLSVAFSFKTGLFNIGAEGQFIIGALTAGLVGYFVKLPAILHIPFIIIIAIIIGGLWASIAGWLKNKFHINEVISTIMLNWIALYLNNFIVKLDRINRPNSEASHKILDSASIILFKNWKTLPENLPFIRTTEIGGILRTSLNGGILIAIICVIAFWFILEKTTLGFKLKAVGSNLQATRYAGINVERNIMYAMFISGALAGLAGAIHVMGVTQEIGALNNMEGYGFNGIAIALLGNNSSIGIVLSSLLFGIFQYGGSKIQPIIGAPYEIINIIIGLLILLIAIPHLIKIILNK